MSRRSSTGATASRRRRTTPRRTCCTQALRDVLGDHVKQAGSAVRPDKLRFDFTHEQPLTPEERERVERIVNEKVFEAIPVRTFVTPIEEARKLGAMMLFGEKYGDEVRVVEIDDYSRGALRRHARALDRGDRPVPDPQRRLGRLRRAADRGGHRRRGVDGARGPLAGARRRPRRARAAQARGEEAAEAARTRDRTSSGRTSRARCSSPRSRARVGARCATSPTSCASGKARTRSCSPRADDGKVALVVNLDNSLAGARRGGDRPGARPADRRRRRRAADAGRGRRQERRRRRARRAGRSRRAASRLTRSALRRR